MLRLVVALAAGFSRNWLATHISMGLLLFSRRAIAPVTFDTTLFAVHSIEKVRITYKYFFPTLQRRDRTTSALAF